MAKRRKVSLNLKVWILMTDMRDLERCSSSKFILYKWLVFSKHKSVFKQIILVFNTTVVLLNYVILQVNYNKDRLVKVPQWYTYQLTVHTTRFSTDHVTINNVLERHASNGTVYIWLTNDNWKKKKHFICMTFQRYD